MKQLSFIHQFEPQTREGARPLLLLHGTGGNESDLLSLGRLVGDGAALLSPRGKVLENGMPRFFRRLSEGVFDEADIKARADELAGFIDEARVAYGLDAPIALGFSNGANIAAALLFLRPEVLSGAILLRAMAPFAEPPASDLSGKPILILSGAVDPIVSADNATRLASELEARGAVVDHRTMGAGHNLTQADIEVASAWLSAR